MSPLPRRMLGRAASWENPQVHPSSLPERKLTYVGVAVAIRLFVGNPHQILNSLVLSFRGGLLPCFFILQKQGRRHKVCAPEFTFE